jgi:hypothetical protein
MSKNQAKFSIRSPWLIKCNIFNTCQNTKALVNSLHKNSKVQHLVKYFKLIICSFNSWWLLCQLGNWIMETKHSVIMIKDLTVNAYQFNLVQSFKICSIKMDFYIHLLSVLRPPKSGSFSLVLLSTSVCITCFSLYEICPAYSTYLSWTVQTEDPQCVLFTTVT